MPKLAVNRISTKVATLGYGNRIAIWVQGCSIGCEGCCAKDTWAVEEDKQIEVNELVDWIINTPLHQYNGITISGGEPLQQPDAVKVLLIALRKHLSVTQDILLYSGYPTKRVLLDHQDIVSLCDAVISEPYKQSYEQSFLRGSSNQKLNLLTDLGRKRYSEEWNNKANYQIDEEELRVIGIRDDAERKQIKVALNAVGVDLQ